MVSQRDGPPYTSVHRRFGGALTRHVEKRQHRFENRARQEEAYKSNFSWTIKYAGAYGAKCGISDSTTELIFGCEYSVRTVQESNSSVRMRLQVNRCKRPEMFDGVVSFAGFRPVLYERVRSKHVRITSWGDWWLIPHRRRDLPFRRKAATGRPPMSGGPVVRPGPAGSSAGLV